MVELAKELTEANPEMQIEMSNFEVRLMVGVARRWRRAYLPLVYFLLAIGSQFIVNQAQAQYFTGAVARGMGGAGRASAEPSEAVMLNPATIVHGPEFSTAGFYAGGQWDSSEHGSLFGFSTYDNEEGGILSGGVAYIQRRRWLRTGFLSEDRYLNVALGRFLSPHFSLGLSVTWLESQVGRSKLEQWNGVVGLLHNPRPDFAWALVLYNPLPVDDKIPAQLRQPMRWGAGLTYIPADILRFRIDAAQNIARAQTTLGDGAHQWDVGGGLEHLIWPFLIFRLGASWERDGADFRSSVGITANTPQFKLDYSLSYLDGAENGALHSVDLRVPF